MKNYKLEKDISHIIGNLNRKLFKGKGFHIFKLMNDWQNFMPEKYANYSSPLALKAKILELKITESAAMIEFEYGKEEICQIINQYFNEEIVTRVKFKLLEKKIKKTESKKEIKPIKKIPLKTQNLINSITDEELREKLYLLAKRIK